MNKLFFKATLVLGIALLFAACTKETEAPVAKATTGSVNLEFEYEWGASAAPFSLHQNLVHPMTGDTLMFHKFKQYISNIRFIKPDGTGYEVPESYYILDADNAESLEIGIENVPSGDYTALEIVFGVDSTRNVSGAQEGALDPANGMFWSWNSGYIMVMAEGMSPNASNGTFAFHLGGFSGENSVVIKRNLSFHNGEVLTTNPNATPTVHLMLNPASMFHSYGSVSTGANMHMPGPKARMMAVDYHGAARVDHIHP